MDQLTGSFPVAGRARLTCQQCRARKVRCDGEAEGCGGCRRLHFDCSLSATSTTSTTSTTSSSLPAPPRQRVSRACNSCQQQKVRCSGTRPRCLHCARRGVACVYQVPPTRWRHRRTSSAADDANMDAPVPRQRSPAATATAAKDNDTCISCRDLVRVAHGGLGSHNRDALLARVDHFLQHAYPLPSYSLLHPATTRAKAAAGQLDPALALALCALTQLHPHIRQADWHASACQGTCLVRETETLVWQQLERPTTARLQALLLCISHRMETGHFQRAFMLVSLAARSVAAMGLHQEPLRPDGAPSVHLHHHRHHQEVRRRIVWSLKLTERYFSHGLAAFELCPFESIDLQLPCREEAFSFSSLGRASGDDDRADDGGALGVCVRLEKMRRDIMKMIRAVCKADGSDRPVPDLVPDLVAQIRDNEQRLHAIGTHFPHGTAVRHADLQRLVAQAPQWIARHVQMHLSWHQCFCDMYRLLLPGFYEAAPPAVLATVDAAALAWAERACVRHACAILDLLSGLNQISAVPLLLEFDTAICAYQAALVVLFIARFGRTPQRPTHEFAASRAALCLAAINRFFPSSALIQPIREELLRAMDAYATDSTQAQSVQQQQQQQHHQAADATDASPASSGTPTTVATIATIAPPSRRRRPGRDGDDTSTDGMDTVVAETVPVAVNVYPASLPLQPPQSQPSYSQAPHPSQSPSFLSDSTSPDFVPADGLLQQPLVETAAFDFAASFPLAENRTDGDVQTLDFPLFPWYGLMEQGLLDGGVS
ncbi:uncharacterized protein SPSK_04996 [Sporothrix schenckii 1099-18]|uniref:Zn(2)-C6 fungal-type domain-containing protein n=1 Tax=Sporothrix schenckii 1099-18 TaxID=1397361 RepID=A0A0F2LWN7_SPOSC|nr:uncharacterized protein SPSK_04996 [Sporothrix schenckii 1099-18]KJR80311.1 hypothetical protein SPSK_04996 [Sporothrix schenckii 1099-18]